MATVTVKQQRRIRSLRLPRLHPVWHVLVGVFWVAILLGIIGAFFFHWDWTGFAKNGTLWDWLQLLSAPVFVSALPFVFRGQWTQDGDKATEQPSAPAGREDEQQTQNDLKIEEERQQGTVLDAYEDYMLRLLLDRNLRESQPGSDVREAARARTLAALRRLRDSRKGDVVKFLYDAGLIYKGQAIVDLRQADLSGALLGNAHLSGADLSDVLLSGATLNRTILKGADLKNADLSGADLSGADLSGADLSGANFSNAALNGTNLRGAAYTEEQLSKAHLS